MVIFEALSLLSSKNLSATRSVITLKLKLFAPQQSAGALIKLGFWCPPVILTKTLSPYLEIVLLRIYAAKYVTVHCNNNFLEVQSSVVALKLESFADLVRVYIYFGLRRWGANISVDLSLFVLLVGLSISMP